MPFRNYFFLVSNALQNLSFSWKAEWERPIFRWSVIVNKEIMQEQIDNINGNPTLVFSYQGDDHIYAVLKSETFVKLFFSWTGSEYGCYIFHFVFLGGPFKFFWQDDNLRMLHKSDVEEVLLTVIVMGPVMIISIVSLWMRCSRTIPPPAAWKWSMTKMLVPSCPPKSDRVSIPHDFQKPSPGGLSWLLDCSAHLNKETQACRACQMFFIEQCDFN